MAFSDPRQVVGQLNLTPEAVVADFGAGSGAYALALASAVRAGGKVYAIDLQKELLERLATLARERHLNNLEVIWGDVEKAGGTKLADRSVDWVIVANLLFQVTGKYTLALEAKRILRPGGRVALIDWQDSFGGLGPIPDQVISAIKAKQIFAEAGFLWERDFLAGDHHWGMILRHE